jgi:phosphate transport system permease protein
MLARVNKVKEALIETAVRLSGVASVIFMIAIMAFLFRDALPVLRDTTLGQLLSGPDWRPTSAEPQFGYLPLMLGSLLVTGVAIALAVPMGVGCAVFIAEVVPRWVREVAKPAVELLAAIPSVVFGFIGLTMVGAWIKGVTGLASSRMSAPEWLKTALDMPTPLAAITGSVVLAFMSLPTIVSIAEDALTAVPRPYRDASLAMGATKWQTIRRVTVPAARSGILASIMLGIGRTIGETMTVLMVTGNSAVMPALGKGLFRPVRTMTATIAAEMGETAYRTPHYHALFMLGLCLLLITFAVSTAADLIMNRTKHVERR